MGATRLAVVVAPNKEEIMRHFGEFAEEPLDADEDVVAVMLPDDLVLPAGAMDRMVAVRERLGGSVLCAFNVTRDEVFNYCLLYTSPSPRDS